MEKKKERRQEQEEWDEAIEAFEARGWAELEVEEERMVDKKAHLSMPFAGEFSLGAKYICRVCGERLTTERSERTRWQEWYYTLDGRRHYKHRCNIFEKELEEAKAQ